MEQDRLWIRWQALLRHQADPTPHDYYCDQTSPQVTVAKRYFEIGSRLLYLGCGAGREVHEARKAGFDAVGVTFGLVDTAFAKEHFGLDIHVQDMHILPDEWSGQFDGVLAFQTLEHSLAPLLAIAEAYRVLDEGGRFYSETPGPGMEDENPYHILCPLPIQLKGWLMKVGFKNIEVGDFVDGDGNHLDLNNPPVFTVAQYAWGTGTKP